MADAELIHELLQEIRAAQAAQAGEMRTLRETVIRLETHGFHEQIRDLREDNQFLRDKIIALETKGQFFSAGIAAGVSIVISVSAGILLSLFRGGGA